MFARTESAIRRLVPVFEFSRLRFLTNGNAFTRRVHEDHQVVEASIADIVGDEMAPPVIAALVMGPRYMRMYPIVVDGRAVATLVFSVRRRLTENQRLLSTDFAREVRLQAENIVLAHRLREVTHRLREANASREPDPGAFAETIAYGGIVVDHDARTASVRGEWLSLTPLEFDLLAHFVTHAERPIDRDELAREVWRSRAVTSNFVDVTVGNLRRKIEAADATRVIHPVRGIGYVLRLPHARRPD